MKNITLPEWAGHVTYFVLGFAVCLTLFSTGIL